MHRIVLVCRTEERALYAKEQILQVLTKNIAEYCAENIIPIACDHSSFDSVRQFNTLLRKRLDETYTASKWLCNGIDVLCLNAAVLMARDSEAKFTQDGLEITFQTNYLAPFLIANLTMDLLNPGARVVLSTSGLHCRTKLDLGGVIDPQTGRARKGFEMPDGRSFHYKESYAVSKLCIVLLCAELDRRLRKRGITVNCFSPGLMTESGLFRNQLQCGGSREVCKNPDALTKVKPIGWGAGALVYMATADETGKQSGYYWRDPDSTLGWHSEYGKDFYGSCILNQVDRHAVEQLWKLSTELVGLPRTNDLEDSVQSNN